jgi:hypothetical protein
VGIPPPCPPRESVLLSTRKLPDVRTGLVFVTSPLNATTGTVMIAFGSILLARAIATLEKVRHGARDRCRPVARINEPREAWLQTFLLLSNII